jgi:peptidoglycan hydrolase-like protein with peptidoglycan-binding domain
VEEIQQALIRTGYLKEEPTGKWDDATREAMRRYQGDNAFPASGLPESKTLMKLGLGPHPLPEDADPADDRRASAQPAPATDATGEGKPSVDPPREPR